MNFNLNKYSILNLKESGLKTKVKGNVIYKSRNRQIIVNVKSKFDEKGFLKFKFNTKLNIKAAMEQMKRNIPRNPKNLGVFANSSKKDI